MLKLDLVISSCFVIWRNFSKCTVGNCTKMLTEENIRRYCIVLLYRIQQFILIFIHSIYKYFHIGGGTTIQNDKNIKNQAINMKGNVHLLNLEYCHCVVYRYKTHIHFVAKKMDGYLQFSTKSTAKAILPSIF